MGNISTAGRKRISDAAKAMWAKRKAAKISTPRHHTPSITATGRGIASETILFATMHLSAWRDHLAQTGHTHLAEGAAKAIADLNSLGL